MNAATPHFSEAERLSLLTATRLLDADAPPALQALVRMAARQTGCPVALVNLVDAHRLFALARHGLSQKHLSREGSMCEVTMLHPDGLVVDDVPSDRRFFQVGDPGPAQPTWRFYAGMPIMVEGMPLGTVCVLDTRARDWTAELQGVLRDVTEAATALVAAQLAARRFKVQEARIRTACQASHDWLWETDSQGHIRWVSASLVQHTGLDPVAEIGLSAADIYSPRNDETRASWERYLGARSRREAFVDAVAERVTPHGRIVVSFSGTPVFNRHGQFMGYRGASRNITRQFEQERRARHNDMLLRQAFDTLHASIMISDATGRIVLANQHWRQEAGLQTLDGAPSWPQLLTQMIKDGRYPDALGREEEFFDWLMDLPGKNQAVAVRLNDSVTLCRDQRLPDGSVVHFSSRPGQAERDADAWRDHDQYERQLAAEKLRQSEERWKFALEGAGDGVWDWEIPTSRVFYSPRWVTMLGLNEARVTDQPQEWFERIHPRERDRVVQAFRRYRQEGEGIFQAEFRLRHEQGHYVWILCRGTVVARDPQGAPARVVGTNSDITRLKQAERVLREKQAAEAASRAKSEFLSRMSHEIRTPLNAVRGFAQLLDQRLDLGQGEAADYVRQIMASSELLSDLVNDVLDLQQIEAGAMPMQRDIVPLSEVIDLCTAMLEPLALQAAVSLRADATAPWHVWGDRRRLQQVLSNLMSNAIKYNRPQGQVRVMVQRHSDAAADTVSIIVEDTGMGMDADQLSRLFQPFERLGRDTSPIQGSGLGLIITRSLLESMGGRLEIRSQPGEGTRVSITMPEAPASSAPCSESDHVPDPVVSVSEALPAALTPEPPADKQPSGRTPDDPLRIMYVEDNRINALLFEEALRPYPELLLEVAEDGQAALSVAREHRPEVLVIDAHLPGMTGFEVLRALRTLPGLKDVPAYMCSADALPEDIAKARSEGFVGYWTKPIDILQVTSELCRLAQGHNVAP